MKNRITHLLKSWAELEQSATPAVVSSPEYPLPRAVNMLTPAELCINRQLLITILSASIYEIHQHRLHHPALDSRQKTEIEAVLQQQLAFRNWAQAHPATYICIALYPVTELEPAKDSEEDPDFPP